MLEPPFRLCRNGGSRSLFDAFSSREPVSTPHQVRGRLSLENALLPDRDPDFEAAIAGERIEFLFIALEVGCVGALQPRCRQPLIPDRVDGAANGRDVIAVGEDRVSLFGDPNAAEFARQVVEGRHFDAGDGVEVSGIVAVAGHAVSPLPDPAGNVLDRLMKALPLAGNAGSALAIVALADAGDEKRLAGRKTRRLKVVDES